jgi:DNA-binding NarL/FixJ family response regulator
MTNDNPISDSPYSARSCARCGRRFRALGREYSCAACRKSATATVGTHARLSFREQQIIALIRQAKTNKEIAYELCLAEGTIKEYLYRIFRKLPVTNRTQLALTPTSDVLSLTVSSPRSEASL